MTPYIIILLLSFSLISLSFYTGQTVNKFSHCVFVPIIFFMLTCFAALRHYDVGTDTINYMLILGKSSSFHDVAALSEPLFSIFSIVVNSLPFDFDTRFILYLFFISFVIVFIYLRCIFDYSKHESQSFLLFFLLGIYTFHFNGARQAITIALFLFAYRFIVNGSFFKYCIVIVIGFFIHKSIILMLPFYWVFRTGLDKRTVSFICMGSVLAAFLIQPIVEFAASYDSRYSTYADAKYGGGGLVSVVFYTMLLIWLLISMKLNRISDVLYKSSVMAMIVSVCIGWVSIVLSLNPSGILRLIVYFLQFSLFSLPVSISSFKDGRTKVVLYTVIYIVLFVYFYLTTFNFSGLFPYKTSIESII